MPTDVVVVGSGPNGLAAAVTCARAGLEVVVLEAQETVGGGARTLDLGLADGVVHDLCSAVHPMAWASPFLQEFDLAARGVELLTPEVSYAQPLDDGEAGIAYRDLERTVAALGPDGPAWRALLGPLAARPDVVVGVGLGDRRSIPGGLLPTGVPTALRYALGLVEQGTPLWTRRFRGHVAPALLTGVMSHAIHPLPAVPAAGAGLLLAALAHAGAGWPLPRGGSQAIVAALRADLEAHGGTVRPGHRVASPADLPPARCVLLDTNPRTAVRVLGDRLPARRRRALERFRYGHGAAKVDFVLSGPVPWAHPEVGRAGTVHVGGSQEQVAEAEAHVGAGRHAPRPTILLSDPTVVDPGREVGGLRPLWTYAHVPAGSDVDVTEAVTAQVERFAPGFRDVVVTSRCIPAARLVDHDENYVGGDISAGALDLVQMVARPSASVDPYRLAEGVYLCSASAPPGPGVHGMAGWFAARRALRQVFDVRRPPALAPGVPA
ncbi:phytoene desaturase family protein [Cellulomonas shaoxiangyii]|uniref:phytoene desaturase family protein n=1 Tax=Cellulomonas shaoxiangyii TaxID=2566013 RepID=UPI001FB84003|nr:NAD(P)/FAD-dependent oxidoreductase [Cellulomonas shaoxiangyii]